VKAASALKANGAERVFACAVHGVLSGSAIERLEAAPIDQVIITNTIPLQTEKARCCKKIKQLSVARLLGQAIRSIHEETSVSSLFVYRHGGARSPALQAGSRGFTPPKH
jgi:ribose-phosphate pyrophosphokinase